MADWKSGGSGKKPNWRGDAAAGHRTARHGWKAGSEAPPGTGRRRIGAALVALMLFGVTGAIVWWVLLPKNPPKPCLVLLANNPADHCVKLDVPMDLYGWQGAKFLAEQAKERASKEQAGTWGAFAPHVALSAEGQPVPLPSSEQDLTDWANSLRNFDPLVIYVGGHCGTGPGGPFLFANGRTRLAVKDLIATLATAPLREKKKLLLLDPGRLMPNVRYGLLTDDFVAQVKLLNKEISACPNLLVIAGCDTGEVAWESEELQATPLAIAVGEALNGATAVTTNDDLITGEELFDFVKKRVMEWTRENRPSASTPCLLPEGNEGRARAAAITVAVKPSTPAGPKAAILEYDAVELERAWKQCDTMAASRPAPWIYQPRLWRRHRELLLRHEQAIRAGETATARKLRAALDAGEETFRGRTLKQLESAVNSAALAAASGVTPADRSRIPPEWQTDNPAVPPPAEAAVRLAILEDVLRKLAPDDAATPESVRRRLGAVATLQKLYEAEQRPVEAHLPVMVHDFYLTRNVPGPPKEWLAAIAHRQRAELCLLGLPADDKQPGIWIFSEAVWPEIREAFEKVDVSRREAEDRLFSTNTASIADAVEQEKNAATSMTEISRFTDRLREAMNAITQRYADWPFDAEWAIQSGDVLLNDRITAWNKFIAAAARLDTGKLYGDSSLENIFSELTRGGPLSGLADEFFAAARNQEQGAAIQGQWLPKQWLLASPRVPTDLRMRLVKSSREISGRLLAGGQQAGSLAGGTGGGDRTSQAVLRGRLALTSLGKPLLDANCARNSRLMKYESIEAEIAKLAAKPGDANLVGVMLLDHWRELASPTAPSGSVDAATERFSRIAIPFDADEALEPATVNQRLRWHELLNALGERTCVERWYDEREQPWFQKSAERYFRDAAAVSAGLPVPAATEAEQARRTTLLTKGKLQVASNPERMAWTSEQKRSVTFELTVPPDYPASGFAAGLRSFAKATPLKSLDPAATTERPTLSIAPGKAATIGSTLDVGNAETFEAACSTSATFYFRGQRPTGDLPIAVNRRPELVLSDPLSRPEDAGISVAVHAAPDLDLGEIVIIVDYSGSMKGDLKGNEIGKNNEYITGPSKYRFALDALEEVLKDLPYQTRLKIRAFSYKGLQGTSKLVFGETDAEARVGWQKGNLEPLNRLMALLRSYEPSGFTPLVDSVIEAAEQDFSREASRTKTLVVLTDGIDEKQGVENTTARMEKLSGDLAAKFRDSDITLLIVQLALGKDDLKLSQELFKSLKSHKNPGRVWNSQDQDRLREDLREALRPKLKLSDASGTPANFPRGGWPARPRDDSRDSRETLLWSPLMSVPTNRRFAAMPYPSADRTEREMRVEDGDRFLLQMAKEDGRTVVRRDLYADYFPAERKKQRADQQWTLTVPTTTVDDSREPLALRGLAFLEKTPAHKIGGADATGTLQQDRPDFLTWDVAPAGDVHAALGTVTIRKLYGYAAPAWDLQAENWPRDTGQFAAAKITAYAVDRPPPSKLIDINPNETTLKVTTAGGDAVEIRPAFETHPIGPNGEPIPCLVLRALHPPGKPVAFHLASPAVRHNAEHRYYRKADSCTAIFGPFTEADFRTQPAKLDLLAAYAVRSDPGAAIELTPPRPTPGVRLEQKYRPSPTKPQDDR